MRDLYAVRIVPGTKISHDYDGGNVKTFSYFDLWKRGIPEIGIPCKQNRLLVIDIDVAGDSHDNDGREWWANFCRTHSMPSTYTVKTRSGGFHFYYWIPGHVNLDTFSPPKCLAPGVDTKFNGWVAAPPTPGYDTVEGDLTTIIEIPDALMQALSDAIKNKPFQTFEVGADGHTPMLSLHSPYTDAQIKDLREKIDWIQQNARLSYDEWRDGLFALKAGIDDEAVLEDLAMKWTMNKGYAPGDENQALSIIDRATKHGRVGPGTIFGLINRHAGMSVATPAPLAPSPVAPTGLPSPFSHNDIISNSKVIFKTGANGSLIIEPTESNAAALIGAYFSEEDLYLDARTGLYIFKGRSMSDTDLVNVLIPILQSPIAGLGFEKFRKQGISGGLDVLMASRRRDPHAEYLNKLQWDGVQRIESFFTKYAGVPDSPYVRLVSKNFWTSLAARSLQPGVKFDTMVILEGDEGLRKSSMLQAIAGKYTYVPSDKNCMRDLDKLREMHQSVITELPELIGIVGMDADTIKAFTAKPVDHIRDLFSKRAVEKARSFCFVGSMNPDKKGNAKYLSTAMGSRRFWPMRIPRSVKSIDLSGIIADRDQLWAEGIEMFRNGHAFWYMPKDLLDPVIKMRVVEEPLIHPIRDLLPALGAAFASIDVYRRLVDGGYVQRGLTAATISRIDECLSRIGLQQDDAGNLWLCPENAYQYAVPPQNRTYSLGGLV